jgi:hypothetical protein
MLTEQEINSLRGSTSKHMLRRRAESIRASINYTFSDKNTNKYILLNELDGLVNEIEISAKLPDISKGSLLYIEDDIKNAQGEVELNLKLKSYKALASQYATVETAVQNGLRRWRELRCQARQQQEVRAEETRNVEQEQIEFRQLVEEVAAFNFSESKQVSQYIMKHRLGFKYRHISGILELERGEISWNYHGGFPPHIYARLCTELGLSNQASDARVKSFKSFNEINVNH